MWPWNHDWWRLRRVADREPRVARCVVGRPDGSRGRSQRDSEAVPGEFHVVGEFSGGGGVVEMVRYVSEVSLPGFELFDNRKALLDGKVGRMWSVTEGVNHEHIQSLKFAPALFWDRADVWAMGDIVDTEPEDGQVSVMEANGSDRSAQQRERVGGDAFKMEPRSGATVVVGRRISEGVVVGSTDLVLDRLFTIQGDRAVEVLSANPQVVEPEDVVGVVVGEHRGVDPVDPFTNQLQSQFRRCVNQEDPFGRFDGNTATSTLILGIVRVTDLAVAPDHRDANAGAGA